MLCYSGMAIRYGKGERANFLASFLNQEELNTSAAEIFSKWISDGAESKKKWVLYFSAIHGGNAMIDVFLRYISEWSENSRGTMAAEAVKALSLSNCSNTLTVVDNIAHRCQNKQIRNTVLQVLDNI